MATMPDDEPLPRHYLVFVGEGKPLVVAARHDLSPADIYRLSSWGFAAHLTDKKVALLRQDPEVRGVEQDTKARMAPHFRAGPGDRVDGSYIVHVRWSSDLDVIAARAGIETYKTFKNVHAIAADLTDEQVMTLRRDPEVHEIEDNMYVTLDD